MREVICKLDELSFQLTDGRSRSFVKGHKYDLDERVGVQRVVGGAGEMVDRPILLADVIGEYITGFEPVPASVDPLPQGDEQ